MRLKDRVAVITGGSRGIGAETARKFAAEGAKVVINYTSSATTAMELVEEITSNGGEALAVQANVAIQDDVKKMFEETINRFGRVDILINNAGITSDGTLLKMSEESFDKVIDINLKGTFNCGQEAARLMAEQGNGVIINASSVVGLYGNFGQTNYSATKWGVLGMTKTWAKELGRKGIRVNAVAPGFIATEMTKAMPEKVLDMMKGKSPLGRLGEPMEIANVYAFLASDEASFMTGSILDVTGGVVL